MEKVLLIEGLEGRRKKGKLAGPVRTCKLYKRVKTKRGIEFRCAEMVSEPGVPVLPERKKPYSYWNPKTGLVSPGGGRKKYAVKMPEKKIKTIKASIIMPKKKLIPAKKKVAGLEYLTGGEYMEGKIRTCAEWQEVYSPVLGKKVKRCKRFAGLFEGLGLEGKLRSCVEWKEVYSPALGKKVKRCVRFAGEEGLEGVKRRRRKLGELAILEDPAKCVEWQEVYSPALGKTVKRCKRFAGEEGGLFEGINLTEMGNALKLGAIAFVPIVGANLLLTKVTLPDPLERIKPFIPPALAFLLAGLLEGKIGREYANAIKIGAGFMLISTVYDRLFAPKLADLLGLQQLPPPEEEMGQLPPPEEEISQLSPEEEFSAITSAPSEESFMEAIQIAPTEEEFI